VERPARAGTAGWSDERWRDRGTVRGAVSGPGSPHPAKPWQRALCFVVEVQWQRDSG